MFQRVVFLAIEDRMEGIIQGTKTFNNSDLKLQHLTRRRTDI